MDANSCPYFGSNSAAEWIELTGIHIHAANDCVYCKLLREIAYKLGDQDGLMFDAKHTRDYGWRRVSYKRKYDYYFHDIEVFVTEGSTKLFPELQNRVLDGSESLRRSLPYAQTWERQCSEMHDSCKQQRGTALPKRLVNVRTNPAHLVETEKHQIGQYIALNHCWGGSRPDCLTTLMTVEKNKEEIADEMLPYTFRDAMEVTRMLGIPYLWIDSLCIVQDDKKEWQEESAKMASYYENSYLTICATAARSDDDGLWPRKESLSGSDMVIVPHAGIQYKIYVRAQQLYSDVDAAHLEWVLSDETWAIAKDVCPLVSRGWTLQERLLAPRLLHYGYRELLWQCPSLAACECCFSAATGSKYMHPSGHLANQARKMQLAGSLKEVAKEWRLLVQNYSGLEFSESTDKLPAISGLAKFCLSVRTPDVYRAGLWESTMIDDLCWKIPFGTIPQARPKDWLAPTWSWASLSQHVSYPFHKCENLTVHARFIEATTVLAGEDPTGEITSGSVTLLGPIQSASVGIIGRSMFQVTANSIEISCSFDSTTDFETGLVQSGSTVFCLRVKTLSPAWEDWIMILVPVDGMLGIYQRVGMAYKDTFDISQYWYLDGLKTKIQIV